MDSGTKAFVNKDMNKLIQLNPLLLWDMKKKEMDKSNIAGYAIVVGSSHYAFICM